MRLLHICIVDDDCDVRSSLENYLRAAGLEVCTFDSAEGFLCSAQRHMTDCLITDLNMPGLDGLGLQRELNRSGCAFPVIMMTAYATRTAREQSIGLGAAAFLEKPVDPDLLIERVLAMLR
jgi:FixJ family two-component response regulator